MNTDHSDEACHPPPPQFLCVSGFLIGFYEGSTFQKYPARNGGFLPSVKRRMEETEICMPVMSMPANSTRSQTSTTIPFSITRSSRSFSLAKSVLKSMRAQLPSTLQNSVKRRKTLAAFCQGVQQLQLLYAKQFRVAGKSRGDTCETLLCSHARKCMFDVYGVQNRAGFKTFVRSTKRTSIANVCGITKIVWHSRPRLCDSMSLTVEGFHPQK